MELDYLPAGRQGYGCIIGIIYSADQEFSYLRKLFQERDTFVSSISKLEVLGYHKITPKQVIYFDAILKVLENVPISDNLITQAIWQKKASSQPFSEGEGHAPLKITVHMTQSGVLIRVIHVNNRYQSRKPLQAIPPRQCRPGYYRRGL